MDFKLILKKIFPHIIAVAAMLIVASVYFYPAWEGQTLKRDDIVKSHGANREKYDFNKYESKRTLWTSSRFSGMPDFLGASYKSSNNLKKFYNIPQSMGVPTEVAFLFWYMLGFYILLVALRVNPWLAVAGSISFALSTYNLSIINVGHFKKVRTLAMIAPVLGGVLLTYKKKYLWGFIITTLFLALQIAHDHVQMSYYFLLGLVCIGLIEVYFHIKEKEWLRFAKSTAIIFAAVVLAIGPNYSKLTNLYKYNKQTIRGKSELTIGNKGVKTKFGLDRDYITQWSSGVSESMMLFIPKAKGDATGYISSDKELLRKVPAKYRNVIGNMNKYWGNQPYSGEPNYFGAVICFLFLIGLFVIKGRLKWGVFIATVLYIMLSWGGNFPLLTNFFIDYAPLYNKFRAPVSILAVAVIFVTFFAIYTVHKIIFDPKLLEGKIKVPIFKKEQKGIWVASILFLGFLVINWLLPESFNEYLSNVEKSQFNSILSQNKNPDFRNIIDALVDFRISLFRADVIRTIFLSSGTLLLLILFVKKKIKPPLLIALVSLLIVVDMWSVSDNFVNTGTFTDKNLIEEEYRLTQADKQIYGLELHSNPELKSKIEEVFITYKPKNESEKESLQIYAINRYSHYRVFNVTGATFQENNTSYAHRSVGGYHAAKLRRYQDMIEHHISKGNRQALNMLNTKYIITKDGVQRNQGALGAVWFVDSVKWADDANSEILALNEIDVSKTVVVNNNEKRMVNDFNSSEANDSIILKSYEPDYMVYESSASGNRLAVFSEVYYPGWTVLVDGEEANYFTANYVLRGMVIPKGKHQIEFIFKPDYYFASNQISMVMYYLMMAFLIFAIGWSIFSTLKTTKLKEG